MKDVTAGNFGLLIAYLVPGLTALWGISFFSPAIRGWLAATPSDAPTVGGFLYLTIGSVAAGLTVSTVRWALIDSLHHHTGVRQPRFDFSGLQTNADAYRLLVENHYRYYQFYANMVLSLALLYVAQRFAVGFWVAGLRMIDLGFVGLEVIFFAGSRDTLRKYYARLTASLRTTAVVVRHKPRT